MSPAYPVAPQINPRAAPTEANMSARTLYDKLWDQHLVRADADGTSLIYVDRHLVHEVTSPQAFEGQRLAGRTARSDRAGYH